MGGFAGRGEGCRPWIGVTMTAVGLGVGRGEGCGGRVSICPWMRSLFGARGTGEDRDYGPNACEGKPAFTFGDVRHQDPAQAYTSRKDPGQHTPHRLSLVPSDCSLCVPCS